MPAVGTGLGTGDKMPTVTLDCMWGQAAAWGRHPNVTPTGQVWRCRAKHPPSSAVLLSWTPILGGSQKIGRDGVFS